MNCQTSLPTSNTNPLFQGSNQEYFEQNFINEPANRNNSNSEKGRSQPFKTTQENVKPEIEVNKQSPHFLLKKLQPDKGIECYLEFLIKAADSLLDQGLDITKLNDSINHNHSAEEFSQRKCDNKICPVKINKASHLYQAKIKQKEHYFCIQCFQAWKKGQFCYYCGIIYREYKGTKGFNQHKSWVGCDYCKNWEHIQCEETKGQYTNLNQLIKNHKFKYKCPICRKEGSAANNGTKKDERGKNSSASYISNDSDLGNQHLSAQTKEEFDKEYEKMSKPLKLKSIKALMNTSDIREFMNDIEIITSVIK